MLDDLSTQRLVVIKVGNKRKAVETNPQWYSNLCASYENLRKGFKKYRTYIKRQDVITILKQISLGRSPNETEYGIRLLPFIEEIATANQLEEWADANTSEDILNSLYSEAPVGWE